MFILRAIGKFFVKIGRWIRDTAWVQPLLIVGGVFAIIFSITPITKWVQSWFVVGDPAANYFGNNGFKKSLLNSKEENSDADKLLQYIEDYGSATASDKEKYGTKFFLAFVEENCAACDATYVGFETLQSNWGTGSYVPTDGLPFKLHTVFVDTVDEDDDSINYFTEYFFGNHGDFFSHSSLDNSPYYKYKASKDGETYTSAVNKLSGEATDNKAPIYFLVDFESTVEWKNRVGVTCVMFNYANDEDCKSGAHDKASYLLNCWNYEGVFSNNN